MADVVDRATRSRMMSGIRGKNTKPELLIRKALHAEGLRFRLHRKDLPGRPDIVLPRYRAVVFVHGCFWHRHDCKLFRLPSSNTAFWDAKLQQNQLVDESTVAKLLAEGWRVAIVWECAIRGNGQEAPLLVGQNLARWLRENGSRLDLRGN